MKTLLNKFSWLLSILFFLVFIAIDGDLFFVGLVFGIIIKIITNGNYIETLLKEYKNDILSELIAKLKNNKIDISSKLENKLKQEDSDKIQNESKKEISSSEKTSKDLEKKEFFDESGFVTSNLEIIDDDAKSIETKKVNLEEFEEVEEKERVPSKFELFLKDFFAENLLAKVGGILLSLGVLFLMSIVYTYVGPILKILIGLILGFVVYFLGMFFERKGYKQEAMVLLGAGILINYIVILSGKYLITGGSSSGILSSSLTFGFLILNTVLAVFTSFIYKSNIFLLFSLIFSYAIPFLTGVKYDSNFISAYSFIISLGGFLISNFYFKDENRISFLQVFYISLVGGNLLLAFSSFSDSLAFSIKILTFLIINFGAIFILYKNKYYKNLVNNYAISYLFFAIIMFLGKSFSSINIFLLFIVGVLSFIFSSSYFFVSLALKGFVAAIYIPLVFVLGFLFFGDVSSAIILLPLVLISYLFVFVFGVGKVLVGISKYFFFAILGIFLIIGNYSLFFDFGLNNHSFFSVFLTSFVFLFSSYYFSFKKEMSFLYFLGTILFILIISPIIKIDGDFYIHSIIAICLFGASNYLLPFINNNLIKSDRRSLISGSILGILFVGVNLYLYGEKYFPGVSLGISFFVLALIYFIGGYFIYSKIDRVKGEELELNLNFIYILCSIAVSLLSISIAIVFSNNPIIISLLWILESSVVIFLASKVNSIKVFYMGNILFFIGTIGMWNLFSYNLVKYDLISLLLIVVSSFFNLYITLKKSFFDVKVFVRVLHFLSLLQVYFFVNYILGIRNFENNFLYTLFYVGGIWTVYNLFKDKIFIVISSYLIFIISLSHLFSTNHLDIYYYNFIITFIISLFSYLQYFYFKEKNKAFLYLFIFYLFAISSVYLYHYTKDYFSLTIYWGILSLFCVHLGIYKKYPYIRTIGLFLLGLTLLKIIFYDIWSSIDNEVIRVIAFLLVGGIMIYISGLYKKNNLALKDDITLNIKENKTKESINKRLENIDVGDKKFFVLNFIDGKQVKIKAKNLVKIGKIIIDEKGKKDFKEKELTGVYDMIKNDYKSDLSKRDYDKIIEILDKFVLEGGSIDLI